MSKKRLNVQTALDEAIKSCDFWIEEVKNDPEYQISDYGKINILGLVKMDLLRLKHDGKRHFITPIFGKEK